MVSASEQSAAETIIHRYGFVLRLTLSESFKVPFQLLN